MCVAGLLVLTLKLGGEGGYTCGIFIFWNNEESIMCRGGLYSTHTKVCELHKVLSKVEIAIRTILYNGIGSGEITASNIMPAI